VKTQLQLIIIIIIIIIIIVIFILSMKNNQTGGCNGIPAEAWKMLVTNTEGNEILTKLLNMFRSKRNLPKEWKTALMQPI
jgi:preprotein translocase subunit SecG